MSTTEAVSAAAIAARDQGIPLTFRESQGIAKLYGDYHKIQAASDRLNSAPPASGLTSDFVSAAPWSRPEQERNALPYYQVRYLADITTPEGEQLSRWQTSMIPGQLPSTVGDLQAWIEQDAAELAAAGGGEGTPRGDLLGVSNMQVLAV